MAIVKVSPSAAMTYIGASTDAKPTSGTAGDPGPKPGDWFIETDTGFVYVFGGSGAWSVKITA